MRLSGVQQLLHESSSTGVAFVLLAERLAAMNKCVHAILKNESVRCSVAVLAEILLRSPRKLLIFIIKKKLL